MTPNQAKDKLKKDGYTYFNLKDFNEILYNQLIPFKCNDTQNLKKFMSSLRVDSVYNSKSNLGNDVHIKDDFDSFENANQKKDEILLINQNMSQIWFYRSFYPILESFKIDIVEYQHLLKKITDFYFDFDESQEYSIPIDVTYYNTGCKLENHSDGTGTGRVCAILIYLNETYNENDGGILVLNNTEKVLPIFGNVAIIDLQSFDIPHMVTEVTGGLGRYAILSFVKRKEDEFK
jgi:Rps23 Pro-64 3,4-dihydroxylase Tpa1-like proline 4-hydroxylase